MHFVDKIVKMGSMKLTSLSEIRRKELRRAAFEVLKTEGINGTTLEKVAAKAGASKGIVLHYFTNKRELFEHAMREANAELRIVVAARLARARNSKERLEAIIGGNFDPRFFDPLICQAWLSLCSEVPRDPTLARIQRVIHGRMDSNLRSALKGVVPDAEVAGISLGVSAMIDGLWLRRGVAPQSLTLEQAIAQMVDFVKSHTGVTLDLRAEVVPAS